MGLGQGSGGAGSIQIGSHPVGMGGSLGASPRGSVTVGLLVLEVTSVDFRLSFAPDATSKACEFIICTSEAEPDRVAGGTDDRFSATAVDHIHSACSTSVVDELAEGRRVCSTNEYVRVILVRA